MLLDRELVSTEDWYEIAYDISKKLKIFKLVLDEFDKPMSLTDILQKYRIFRKRCEIEK